MEYRPYYLAREWVRMGHNVQIVAASYSHVRSKQPDLPLPGEKNSLLEQIDGIVYRWYPTSRYSGNGIGRVRNIAEFLTRVFRDSKMLVHDFKPDVVIASSTYPMDIWVAKRIARLAGARLVFEVHDLWPLTPIEVGGMSRFHPFIGLCTLAEKAAYKDADVVISMLPKVHEYMKSRGLRLDKLTIVPNGVSLDEWERAQAPALETDIVRVVSRAKEEGRVVVGYAGSHGLPNALDTLLDAAKLVANEPLEIVMVGDGHEKQRLLARLASESIVRVHMFPPISKAQIPVFLESIDIAYIGWQRSALYRFGIAPNKLMDYMMAGCAVLHSVEAGNDPVRESACGMTVLPESPDEIAKGLRTMTALTAEERRAMGKNGRAFVLANHTYAHLADKFMQAVNPAVSCG
jgi:glycosyltransferase involved in cell wall biosynthesis